MKLFLQKVFFLMLITGCCPDVLCQNIVTDTTVTLLSYWNKGETKTFTVQLLKEKYAADKKLSGSTFRYIVTVTVLDSTAEGYKMQWALDLPEAMKRANPKLAEQMPAFSGLKVNYLISGTGQFIELINWKDVSDAYVKMMESSLPPVLDDSARLAIEKTKQLFNSKEMVEYSLIKDIKLYHVPFGLEYTRAPFSLEDELENPFGGEPIPSIKKIAITVNEAQDYFNLVIDETLDAIKTENLFEGIMQQLGLDAKKIMDNAKRDGRKIPDIINSQRHSEYKVDLSTGWINKVFYRSISQAGDSKQVESYLIELKNR